jgi:predicted DNA binding CopG/RHH family protein
MKNIRRRPSSGKRRLINMVVSEEEHKKIKERAASRGVTMTYYILQAIEARIMQEKKYEHNE